MVGRGRLLGMCLAWAIAVQSASAAPAQTPTRAREGFARAIELQAQGNHAAALSLLWDAAGLAPADAEIQHRLGEALERMGALDAAADAYRRAVSERPAFRKASNSLILVLVKSGKGNEAIERARALVAAAPADADSYFTLGLAQSEQDVTEAIDSFRRALALEPRHALARYNLALVFRRADRLPEALDELGRALAIQPRPEIHYAMGITYWRQGHLDRAASALRAALASEPRYADAQYTLGAVLKAGRDWSGAAASLRRAIALQPDHPAAHDTLAQVLRLSGDEDGARAHLVQADRLRHQAQREQEAGVWTAVGVQQLDRGNLLDALDDFRRATTAFEAYAPAHYQMGRTLARLGDHDAARAAFDRARQLNPSLVPPRDLP